ncbi:MAG: hypothetical protein ACOCV2_06205 [Persicimonas sp.]
MQLFLNKHRGLLAATALFVSALLLQSLGAAFVHVTLVEHTFCEDHQALEHTEDGERTHEGHGEAGHDEHAADSHAGTTDLGDHLPGEHDDEEESCEWLTWLQGPTVPAPSVHASLIDLPPPADDTVTPLAARADIPDSIGILHLSPGHSPPA